jgi:hypothetical protein
MARHYFFIIVTAIAVTGCQSAQKEKRHTFTDSNVVVNDTFYLRRQIINDSIAEAVYIDSNQNSSFYYNVFNFNDTDVDNIVNYMNGLHEKGIALKIFRTYGLATQWVPLYLFRSKYYLYQPSDWGTRAMKYLTKSSLMFYDMDGYRPLAMQSFTRINDNIFNLKLIQATDGDEYLPEEVNIYIIEKKNNLAVWEYKTGNSSTYQLMIPKYNVRQYPIIAITSDFGKRGEYGFEQIDFKKLIAEASK